MLQKKSLIWTALLEYLIDYLTLSAVGGAFNAITTPKSNKTDLKKFDFS